METKRRRLNDTDVPSKPQILLNDIPTTPHYTISYMHKQTVTHVTTSTRHGYVLTGGVDGVVKFWKRTATASPTTTGSSGPAGGGDKEKATARCLEFVKSYNSHSGPLLSLTTSLPNGDSAVSVGYDSVIKFYDVATFDVSGMIRTTHKLGRHAVLLQREDLYLLVSTRALSREEAMEREEEGPLPAESKVGVGSILMFSGTNLSSEPIRVIPYHACPVTAMGFNPTKQLIVSADVSGVLEVWNVPLSSTEGSWHDDGSLPFESKLDTGLYALMKKKTYAIDVAVSLQNFAVYSSDRKIRLFSFQNCKLICIYDERLKVYDSLLTSKSSAMGIDAIEYGKRAAVEREMEDAYLLSGGVTTNPTTKQSFSAVIPASEGTYHQSLHLTFDNTGKYLLVPTIVGVKLINIQSHKVVATIGKGDASSLRFLYLCLCPGDAKINQQMQLARMGGSSAAITHGDSDEPNDSLLIALAYGKRRFYTFSHHDPLANHGNEEQIILARDVLNEAPDASDLLEASHLGRGDDDPDAAANLTAATKAILRTTHGDITIKLFPKEVPKTIQNFCGHAQSGYYDNIIFHRIIPGFMIQTGDPLGDGTGGESIWGGEFEDEIRRELRHDRPFTVSMANAGPNTNGSQFFITTVPTPWLDNKHTVFGRVTGGMEVVMAIEGVKTDELDRPLSEVKILSIDVS